jgi:uncharacterized protein (DUF362 family)/Pyruvate/2-oxoacid:ferredoxin oxidoreductase delta subunit
VRVPPSVVAIVRCESYERETVARALTECLELLGGLSRWVRPRARVLVKINHLGDHTPEEAIVVHPLVTELLAGMCKAGGAHVVVGDGLGRSGLEGFGKSGTLKATEAAGVTLVNFKGSPHPSVPVPGRFLSQVPVAQAVLDAEVVISLAKMKTHVLTLLTGAIKNTYGYPPVGLCQSLHRRYATPADFAQVVVDVFQARPPDLTVVDAVVALEGYGPSRGGRPKPVKLLLASEDAVALDAVLGELMGYGGSEVPTTVAASRRGLGEGDRARIEIRGVGLAEARPKKFALPERVIRAGRLLSALPRPLYQAFRRLSRETIAVPEVLTAHCIACGLCVRHCPTGAAQMVRGEKAAHIDRNLCISCFCCQEFCESDAIGLTHRPMGALILFVGGFFPPVRRALRSVWQGLVRRRRGKRQG